MGLGGDIVTSPPTPVLPLLWGLHWHTGITTRHITPSPATKESILILCCGFLKLLVVALQQP